MVEHSQFSPSEQDAYKGSLAERFMLRRIGRRVMLLPEKFDEVGKGGALIVHGSRSKTETIVKLSEQVTSEDCTIQFTDITVSHPAAVICALEAERYETDEMGELMGIEPSRQRFVLGSPDNDISLYRVMRTMTLAQHTVEWAQALRHLATAEDPTFHEGHLPRTF